MPLHIRSEHLILQTPDQLFKRLTLADELSVPIDLRLERAVTDLSKSLVHALVPHVVGV
jgi:hypothetical protein